MQWRCAPCRLPRRARASADTGVVRPLRTCSSAWSADEPCVHAGPTDSEVAALRLSCPSSVQLDVRADEAAGWHMDHQQLAAGPWVLNHYRLTHGGTPSSRAASVAVELVKVAQDGAAIIRRLRTMITGGLPAGLGATAAR